MGLYKKGFLAALVISLMVPMAAWAYIGDDDAIPGTSVLTVDEGNQTYNKDEVFTVKVDLLDVDKERARHANGNLYVWAEEIEDQASSSLGLADDRFEKQNGLMVWRSPDPTGTIDVKMAFLRPGKYTIKAAYRPEGDYPDHRVYPSRLKEDSLILRTVNGTTGISIDEPADDFRKIVFQKTKGEVGKQNDVWMQVYDHGLMEGLGSRAAVARAKIIKQPEGAQVSAVFTDTSHLYDRGEAKMAVTSSKAGEAVIRVTLRGEDSNKTYTSDLTFTFDAKDPVKPTPVTKVTMTIGNKDMLVGDMVRRMEVAPYVDAHWRTMVPYRALAEAFGAKVNWSDTERTVTTMVDDKKVVMTIGSKNYTVNGKAMTMDTAPAIDKSGRTMMPVRFVAEALGYKVEANAAGNGTTGTVLFSK